MLLWYIGPHSRGWNLIPTTYSSRNWKPVSIFPALTDRRAKCHFRDFSAVMFKSLTIFIVRCMCVKPSFLCPISQSIFQGPIIPLSWAALSQSVVILCSSATQTFHVVSHAVQQRRGYSMIWWWVGTRGFQGEPTCPIRTKVLGLWNTLRSWDAAINQFLVTIMESWILPQIQKPFCFLKILYCLQ